MSSTGHNPTTQPLRPKLAATTSSTRNPLTPRVTTRPTPSVRSEPPSLRIKQGSHEATTRDVLTSSNITPRSAVRSSKIGSAGNTPTQSHPTPNTVSPRPVTATAVGGSDRIGGIGSNGINGSHHKMMVGRPKSMIGDSSLSRGSSRLSPTPLDHSPLPPADTTIESRFFHASDASNQEPAPKRVEPKKQPAFFYADGQQEGRRGPPVGAALSPGSTWAEQHATGPWIKPERTTNSAASPPMLSPGLSTISQSSSFFPPHASPPGVLRPPSPSKENIHLSYRKGASQIFGTRPLSTTRPGTDVRLQGNDHHEHLARLEPVMSSPSHRKSPSLSSIDSGSPPTQRQRSFTSTNSWASPNLEIKSPPLPRLLTPLNELPTITTATEEPGLASPPAEGTLSPTKHSSELAADARRERKVLDLEISNSSLLAINSSLEREVRRQKAELKRFRRLSRAGHFSFGTGERTARLSEGLSMLGEEDEDGLEGTADSIFGPSSAQTNPFDDGSDDDSAASSTGLTSPSSASCTVDSDRLARDEKRLRIDLERHKELLVQSQMMNQTIKRCVYATEEMIVQGKKALDYQVRVSDVRLGGRVLNNDEDKHDETNAVIEPEMQTSVGGQDDAEDETQQGDEMAQAKEVMDVWSGLGRPSYESSDRDSGIEVEKSSGGAVQTSSPFLFHLGEEHMGRPPDVRSPDSAPPR